MNTIRSKIFSSFLNKSELPVTSGKLLPIIRTDSSAIPFVKDKTVLFTGGSGVQATASALELAKLGAEKIILASRDVTKAEMMAEGLSEMLDRWIGEQEQQAKELSVDHELLNLSGVDRRLKPTQFDVQYLDLANFDTIWDFCANISKREKVLHILVNNAGTIAASERMITVDGNELTFQTNYLGHYLLTVNLLELLSRSSPSRIINVAASHSSTFMCCPFGFRIDDPNFERRPNEYNPLKAYALSKLAVLLFNNALNRRVNSQGISVYSVDPGVVRPDSLLKLPEFLQNFLEPLFHAIFKDAGEQITFCATEPGEWNFQFDCSRNCRFVSPGRIVTDAMADELWKLSKELAEKRGHYPTHRSHRFPNLFF